MKRSWKFFSSLTIGETFYFDYYPNSTKWVKKSDRTVLNTENNRVFYASKNEIVWVFK